MKHKWQDIELAYEYVSSTPEFQNGAVLNKKTGKIYYRSDMAGEDEIPEEAYEDDNCIDVPHKNDLDLGKRLVMDFTRQYIPDYYEEVDNIFRSKGAYSRFKYLLEKIGKLDEWYSYENEKTNKALREWCSENGIEIYTENY